MRVFTRGYLDNFLGFVYEVQNPHGALGAEALLFLIFATCGVSTAHG